MTRPSIHVAGDAHNACFYIRPGEISDDAAYCFGVPVGVPYIFRAIRMLCSAKDRTSNQTVVSMSHGKHPFRSIEDVAWYELKNIGGITGHEAGVKTVPLLRPCETETVVVRDVGARFQKLSPTRANASATSDILVHWLGEFGSKHRAKGSKPANPLPCKIHLQIGLSNPLQPEIDAHRGFRPADLAKPQFGRVIVVNIGEISATHRIRRFLSYEAIAVDLLRFLRGDGNLIRPREQVLRQLSMMDADAPWSALAVRINNSAVFLYMLDWREVRSDPNDSSAVQEEAWLLCHKEECAPLTQPELGQMVGFTGFVSSTLAACLAHDLCDLEAKQTHASSLFFSDHLVAAVRSSLIWQRASFRRGYFHLLFDSSTPKRTVKSAWKPASTLRPYQQMFDDIAQALEADAGHPPGAEQVPLCQRFSELAEKKILKVKVQIDRAVAHRTQWFMARSIAAAAQPGAQIDDQRLNRQFFDQALSWLTKGPGRSPAHPNDCDVPIVRIGDANLTDRREIEDFLAIHHALKVYANSDESKPLSIAVFGSPGSGKSFAVNQVVAHLSRGEIRNFQTRALSFNLSQFKSLDDLPSALHLVRNECLSGQIPIVFFDEFDSTFNVQPFGWLKFFLAPMQDGEFYHAGHNYKLGRAVFVFAGGINRSFEELNSRVRNPGFCDAKGPDFISRLKAHLNVQGINNPEDEADQSRYILRRGILLRGLVMKKLGLGSDHHPHELLQRSVARALLSVNRFRHGVRSLEAIIKMCSTRRGYPIGPSDLPSMDQLEMHVDASELLREVDKDTSEPALTESIPHQVSSVRLRD